MTKPREPKGQLQVRVCAMPKDANFNGDIFGGWLLSHLDLAGAGFAASIAKKRVTTVAIESMTFEKPVYVGEFVCFHAETQKIGRTSIRVGLEAWAIAPAEPDSVRRLVCEAAFTYVALDEDRKPTPVLG